MCELFAMSSDQPVRLRYMISEFATHGGERFANRDGWGIVFTQPRDAYLFKDPSAASASGAFGDTDSELAFLLLLECLADLPATASSQARFAAFTDFCAEMRAFGDANFLYAEGETLYVHAHKRRYEKNGVIGPPRVPGLHMRKLERTEANWRIRGAHLADESDHRLLIASVPLDEGPWENLQGGVTLLIENGSVRLRAPE